MIELNKKIQKKFDEMSKTGKLFRSELTGQQVWDLYISSFPKEYDPVFRDPNSSYHKCNLCNNFIRRYGNIVSIDENYNVVTMFDVEGKEEDLEYLNSLESISTVIKKSKISEVFFETYDELNSLPYESISKRNEKFKLGIERNTKRYTKEESEKYGVVKPDEIKSFNHFNLTLDKLFVDSSGKSVESIMGKYRDAKEVFQRAMETIPVDTLNLVKDLINQGSLLNGETHLFKVEKMIPLKLEYDNLSKEQRENWCWVTSYNFELAKFRNELIGVLCSELAEGKEINEACLSWNKRVDSVNYMKAKAPITKFQKEQAKQFVEENGYVESFSRRFATMADIRVSEILHTNVGKGEIKSVSIFDGVKPNNTRHKRNEFDGVEKVGIEKFMKYILPGCTSIQALLTNQHDGNLVSLTTSTFKESKQIFKWSNPFSWTYNGNLAGKSMITQAVKDKGGRIDGVLRFSITWNEDGKDVLDFDAHCIEPDGTMIYYGNKDGKLDVDMISPMTLGVENIVYVNLNRMKPGVYKFFIKNYNGGGNRSFKAEIGFNGEIYSYHYQKPVAYKEEVHVAEVTLKDKEFSIKHLIPESSVSSKELYGLETNQFHKVNLVCLSPNHWNNESIGNKHYFFMLEDCKSPNSIRSFHNENLLPELAEHRKVLEVLGATNQIDSTDGQLSGLGFNATVREKLILKLEGTHKRVIEVEF